MSSLQVIPITADYTLTIADVNTVMLVDATSVSITITLPDISAPVDGINYYIKRTDTTALKTVTVVGFSGSQLIDGLTSILSTKLNPRHIVSSGGNWHNIGN